MFTKFSLYYHYFKDLFLFERQKYRECEREREIFQLLVTCNGWNWVDLKPAASSFLQVTHRDVVLELFSAALYLSTLASFWSPSSVYSSVTSLLKCSRSLYFGNVVVLSCNRSEYRTSLYSPLGSFSQKFTFWWSQLIFAIVAVMWLFCVVCEMFVHYYTLRYGF